MQDGTFSEQRHPEVTQEHAAPQEKHQEHEKFDASGDCAIISDILSRVGDKWSILIVATLGGGKLRFSELRRKVGTISQKMLTTTLRNLERDGFVVRTVYPTIPPKVEYELTTLGHDLLCPVEAMGRWAQANAKHVLAARDQFDHKKADN
jgi:DNA-binding HxlR family transcriptional regulator